MPTLTQEIKDFVNKQRMGFVATIGPTKSQIPLSDVVNKSLKHIVIIDTYPLQLSGMIF